jgi:hypothetical protein
MINDECVIHSSLIYKGWANEYMRELSLSESAKCILQITGDDVPFEKVDQKLIHVVTSIEAF